MSASDGSLYNRWLHVQNSQSASLPLLSGDNQATSIESSEPLEQDLSLQIPLQHSNAIPSRSYIETESTVDLDRSVALEPARIEPLQSNM
jgi:hypothetical protein